MAYCILNGIISSSLLFQLREKESEYKKTMEQLQNERDELNHSLRSAQEGSGIDTNICLTLFQHQHPSLTFGFQIADLERSSGEETVEKLKKQLQTEQLLKAVAVNKLAEIMNRKDLNLNPKKVKGGHSGDLRKKERECRKIQQELTQEKEKFNQMTLKWQKELQDVQASLNEENQIRLKLQMELDSKDSEIEALTRKMCETASVSSNEGDGLIGNSVIDELRLEGWISLPSKQNIRRHGWRKQYVVVSSRKIIFYNSDQEKQNPTRVLDLK